MPRNRTTKAKRASAWGESGLRAATPTPHGSASSVKHSRAVPANGTDQPTGRPAQREAIEQAMAHQDTHLARSPGAMGPIGRTVLLIALLTLLGVIAVWVLLAV